MFSDEEASVVALRAVAFIAGDADALAGLLRMTGIDGESLRHGLDDPAILGGVLAFLLENEARLLAFCAETNLPPTAPGLACARLQGRRPAFHNL